MKRRLFVQGTAAATAVVAAGALPFGCGPLVEPAPFVDVPLSADGFLRVSTNYAELDPKSAKFIANQGGAITIRVMGTRPPEVPEAVLLVRQPLADNDPQAFVAMNSACPHLGCPLGWGTEVPTGERQPVGMVKCPCHQSRFRLQSPDIGACISVDHKPALVPPVLYSVARDASDPDHLLVIRFDGGNTTLAAAFADFPVLAQVGGAAVVPVGCAGVVVVRTGATTAEAYSATCTHLGCTVAVGPGNELDCPCHGSVFDLKGQIKLDGTGEPFGPANQPLPKFAARVEADKIVVTF